MLSQSVKNSSLEDSRSVQSRTGLSHIFDVARLTAATRSILEEHTSRTGEPPERKHVCCKELALLLRYCNG
jgi:hypothetical protein